MLDVRRTNGPEESRPHSGREVLRAPTRVAVECSMSILPSAQPLSTDPPLLTTNTDSCRTWNSAPSSEEAGVRSHRGEQGGSAGWCDMGAQEVRTRPVIVGAFQLQRPGSVTWRKVTRTA
jgi:hypothetical protein